MKENYSNLYSLSTFILLWCKGFGRKWKKNGSLYSYKWKRIDLFIKVVFFKDIRFLTCAMHGKVYY